MAMTGNYVTRNEIWDFDTAIKQLATAVIIRLIYDMQCKNLSIEGNSKDKQYKKRKVFYSAVEFPLRYADDLNFWLSIADLDHYADDIISMAQDKFKRGYPNK